MNIHRQEMKKSQGISSFCLLFGYQEGKKPDKRA